MATLWGFSKVELAIGYTFKQKNLLKLSLTAAGADVDNHEGNRNLAKLGQTTIHFVIAGSGYEANLAPDDIHAMHTFFESKDQRAAVADSAGIVSSVKLCERSGAPSKTVKSFALSALIGAVWLDSLCVKTVSDVLTRLLHMSAFSFHSSSKLITGSESNAITIPMTVNPTDTLLIGPEPVPDRNAAEDDVAEPPPFRITPEADNVEFEQIFGLSKHDFDEIIRNHASVKDHQQAEWRKPTFPTRQEEDHVTNSLPPERTKVKRRKRTERLRNSHDCSQWLGSYIREDEERCKKHNIPSPWQGFRLQTVAHDIANFSSPHREIFLKIWVGLCNPASVIELRDTIRILRDDNSLSIPSPQMRLSTNERLRVIETTEQKIASLTLLRRLHVLRLWQDEQALGSKDPCWVTFDGVRDLDPDRTKKPGNPRNAAETQATALFMERMGSNLDRASPDFQRLFNRFKRLRKLGRRLDMLNVQFGQGILALMPCSDLNSSTRLNSAISDSMLLTPTDDDFKGFLSVLESTQGEILHKFSLAAYPIVKCIYNGTLGQCEPFPLEQTLQGQISSSARGPALLSCFSVRSL